MTETTLTEAIQAARHQIGVLQATGLTREADILTRQLGPIEAAARPFTDWLSEAEACLMSGHTVSYHRGEFPSLLARGLARFAPTGRKQRQYLRCAIRQRANVDAARDAGLRGERVG